MSALDRRNVVRRLVADRGAMLVIAGLGSSAYDLAAAGDDAGNFYLWGAMGGAALMGLGLALAQPKRMVMVVTGDGEMLMGLGGLATIGAQRPPNLKIVVLDNGRFGETGMQASHTGLGLDLAAVARAAKFDWAIDVDDDAAVDGLVERIKAPGCGFARARVKADALPRVLPPRDGAFQKARFRTALGLPVS